MTIILSDKFPYSWQIFSQTLNFINSAPNPDFFVLQSRLFLLIKQFLNLQVFIRLNFLSTGWGELISSRESASKQSRLKSRLVWLAKDLLFHKLFYSFRLLHSEGKTHLDRTKRYREWYVYKNKQLYIIAVMTSGLFDLWSQVVGYAYVSSPGIGATRRGRKRTRTA